MQNGDHDPWPWPDTLKDRRRVSRLIFNLRRDGATADEVAVALGLEYGAFLAYLAAHPDIDNIFRAGMSIGRTAIRRQQMQNQSGQMQRWLGIQRLSQSGKSTSAVRKLRDLTRDEKVELLLNLKEEQLQRESQQPENGSANQ